MTIGYLKPVTYLNSEFSDEEIVPKNPKYRRYDYRNGTYERISNNYHCDVVNMQCTVHSNPALLERIIRTRDHIESIFSG